MSTVPLVSVVLPTFNRRELLPRAIHSVLGQTHRNLELIVVDDASTDGTGEWLAGCRDPRLVRFRRDERGGPARARNDGLRRARGAFVAFQDSDDEWLPLKLETQLALLERHRDVGLAVCSFLVHEDGLARLVRAESLIAGQGYEPALLLGFTVATPTWLARREVLDRAGAFDDDLPCLEDWDLCFRIHASTRVRSPPGPLLVKHGNADSISADPRRHLAGLRAIHERHAALWRRHPIEEARLLHEIGTLQCQYASRRDAIASVQRAIRLHPQRLALYWTLAALLFGRTALRQALVRPRR